MTNSKKLFIIGITVFLAIIILIVGMFYLQDISIKNSNYSFNVIFKETPGLYEGDDVKMFGKKIGVITDIRILDKKINVELSIDNSFAFKIPIDSKIQVKSEGFLGTKYISIASGSDNNKFISVGETVYGIGDYDLSEITTEIGPIAEDLGLFMNRLNTLFRDEEKDKIRQIVSNIESVSNNINQFSDINKNIISSSDKEKIKRIIDDLSSISSILKDKLDNDINSIIGNMEVLSQSAPDLKETIENLKKTTLSFDEISKDLNKMVSNLENKNNTLGKLIYEDSLYTNINGVALDLRDLIKDIKENPTKYMKAYFQGKK